MSLYVFFIQSLFCLFSAAAFISVPHILNASKVQFRYVFLNFSHHKGYDSRICRIEAFCRKQASATLINGGVDVLLQVTDRGSHNTRFLEGIRSCWSLCSWFLFEEVRSCWVEKRASTDVGGELLVVLALWGRLSSSLFGATFTF